MSDSREQRLLLISNVVILVALGARPLADRFTWLMENLPVLIVLMVGGHYTYAQVPLFDWIRDALGLARNHYDRLGHFAQGFVPAIVIREVLLRRSPLRRGPLLALLTVASCLALSACYEFVEWWTALATGEAATAFLGTQGDPWDTQWDMFLALVGATSAVVLLSGAHDRALARLEATSRAP